jgi:proteasome lid subunit RPN8/RPN11
MILELKTEQLKLMQKECWRMQPIEACALLFGKISARNAVLEKLVITPNVLKSSVRFEIDPKTFYDALVQAADEGLEFIGFFHSHPAPAYPSNVDIKFMRLWGDAIWLIMSSIDTNFAAFQMLKSKIQKVTMKEIKI